MGRPHLYLGFRHAGALGSISEQRTIQQSVLRSLQPRRILSVGCAYGDELAELLRGTDLRDEKLSVSAIDLCDVGNVLYRHDFASILGDRFRWKQHDLLEIRELPGYGSFDAVQCGFVLHDIPWELKDQAIRTLQGALRIDGHLIISEIVAELSRDYVSEIADIYDDFITEADACRMSGQLDTDAWQLFVGNGVTPGLRRSKAEAIQGDRDFFDTLVSLVERAEKSGLQMRRVIRNRVNHRLAILVARRHNHGSRQPLHPGDLYVQ